MCSILSTNQFLKTFFDNIHLIFAAAGLPDAGRREIPDLASIWLGPMPAMTVCAERTRHHAENVRFR